MKELALHVLDVAQNSIAAGSTNLEIIIDVNSTCNILCISIQDNGCGMDKEFVSRAVNTLATTKTNKNAGLGLPLLNRLAHQCEGSLKILSGPGSGTQVIATFKLNHPDLPPIGDMAATIVTLLFGRADVDLVYRHVVNGQEYVLDTKKIKGSLEYPALSEPKSLLFLKSLLQNELAKLNGGE